MADARGNRLDELDMTILGHLREDGRKSFTDIARALDVAVGTVRNRLNKMTSDGTVRIIPRVNPQRVGFDAPVTISVWLDPSCINEAIATIADFPEVSWLASVTGPHDLVVDVMCRDLAHLNSFLVERLSQVPGVKETQTAVYLKIHRIAMPELDSARRGLASEDQDNHTGGPR